MRVLAACKPEKVFYYFEEICKIPHGSGNVEGISNYLADFAKTHQLSYIQDEWKNIIIFKKASVGYEEEPTVILQGHMDMVAVKKPDCDIDMRTEGLRLAVDGDKVYAEGTSLGGDDGIAVAYALALLDDESLCHPALEIIITVDEEVGMDGARAIDLSGLKGHRMINLDSEEEGIFLTSCAGGARVDCHMPVHMTEMEGIAYEVEVDGLQGGHSGAEIHKGRANANCVMARLLNHLKEHCKIGITGLDGGLADNAIPRHTKAVLVVPKAEDAAFAEILDAMTDRIAAELAVRDPEFKVHACETGKGSFVCLSAEDTAKCVQWLYGLPNGVQAMSVTMPGLVETSLNLGILQLKKETAKAAKQGGACSCRTENEETVVLLSHKKPDGHINVKVEFGEGEGKVPLDNIAKRAESYKPKERVTYKMIKEYIEAKYGFKVHTAYIAEVKRDLGLPMYDAPNAVEELKQPRKHPTAEKVEAIKDALKHFEVI